MLPLIINFEAVVRERRRMRRRRAHIARSQRGFTRRFQHRRQLPAWSPRPPAAAEVSGQAAATAAVADVSWPGNSGRVYRSFTSPSIAKVVPRDLDSAVSARSRGDLPIAALHANPAGTRHLPWTWHSSAPFSAAGAKIPRSLLAARKAPRSGAGTTGTAFACVDQRRDVSGASCLLGERT